MNTERRFWRRLGLWTLLLLILGAAACVLLWQYLAAYEQARPEPVMDALMADMTPEDWYEAVKDAFTGDLSEFEQPGELLEQYFDGSLKDKSFSCRRDMAASSRDEAVFIVRAGHVNFARVLLGPVPDSGLGFGLHRWQLERIEPADILAGLRSVTVEIDAAPGQQIFVNGLPLTERYLVDGALPCPELSELESRYAEPPRLLRYRIEKMYGEIAGTTADGTLLEPESAEGVVRYFAAGLTRRDLRICAPADVTVTVCGAKLLPEDAASRSLGVLADLEQFTRGDEYETLRYELTGLYREPEVRAFEADGTELEPVVTASGTLHFFHANSEEYQQAAQRYVQEFFNAYTAYSTRAYSGALHGRLLGYILPGTEFYEYIRGSKDTMIWAVTTTVNRFEDLSFSNFHRLNDTCFVCTVRYRANMTMAERGGDRSYDEENLAELCFVRPGNDYLCAAMSFVTD